MRSDFRTTGLDDLSAVEFVNVLELWGVVSDPVFVDAWNKVTPFTPIDVGEDMMYDPRMQFRSGNWTTLHREGWDTYAGFLSDFGVLFVVKSYGGWELGIRVGHWWIGQDYIMKLEGPAYTPTLMCAAPSRVLLTVRKLINEELEGQKMIKVNKRKWAE